VDLGIGPCQPCQYVEDGEGSREEGGERGGDGGSARVKGSQVEGGQGA